MLNQIHIRDLATIEELHLYLNDGSTMITGETGAGKSIFIEAIELALGGRASPNMIRMGKDKADISLSFDITEFPHVIERLKSLDLYHDTPECMIRRVIGSDGRSRSYVNGSPSPLQLVKELGDLLFHLHSQHEQQVLLKAETQRDMLDRFADHLPLALQVKQIAEAWREVDQEIKELHAQKLEHEKRCDYLRFQLDELETAKLQPGEWETLEMEHHKLTHAEELMRHIQHVLQLVGEDETQTILSMLNDTRKICDTIRSVEPKATEWTTTLDSVLIQMSDLESELQTYLASTELDPERLKVIEERVSQIFNLSRKHKISPPELIELQTRLSTELSTLEASDETLNKLEAKQKDLEKKYTLLADQLSQSRKQAASQLETEITKTIRSLSLPFADFKIVLERDSTPLSFHGNEKVLFLIKTNPDQLVQPLAKVVSGGELSRLSLAAHLALANQTSIPTLVFDEVDTGLSGATAEKIGKLLRKLGNSYQVFCVTHQPQVAACGHHHLLVEKYFVAKTTHTRLRLLDGKEKTREIARMLGGEKITQKTVEHAEELLASNI